MGFVSRQLHSIRKNSTRNSLSFLVVFNKERQTSIKIRIQRRVTNVVRVVFLPFRLRLCVTLHMRQQGRVKSFGPTGTIWILDICYNLKLHIRYWKFTYSYCYLISAGFLLLPSVSDSVSMDEVASGFMVFLDLSSGPVSASGLKNKNPRKWHEWLFDPET